MSSAMLKINFAYADATAKSFEMGPFAVNSASVMNFKTRLQQFNSADAETQKKITNFETVLKSENGANLTGIKSATITVSQTTRIFDASTYQP